MVHPHPSPPPSRGREFLSGLSHQVPSPLAGEGEGEGDAMAKDRKGEKTLWEASLKKDGRR